MGRILSFYFIVLDTNWTTNICYDWWIYGIEIRYGRRKCLGYHSSYSITKVVWRSKYKRENRERLCVWLTCMISIVDCDIVKAKNVVVKELLFHVE